MSRKSRNPAQLASRLHRTATGLRGLAADQSRPEILQAYANTCDEAATRLEAQTKPSTPASVGQDAARARRFADRLQRLTREEPR